VGDRRSLEASIAIAAARARGTLCRAPPSRAAAPLFTAHAQEPEPHPCPSPDAVEEIDIPPPRPKRKPSKPYPKKDAGADSSGVADASGGQQHQHQHQQHAGFLPLIGGVGSLPKALADAKAAQQQQLQLLQQQQVAQQAHQAAVQAAVVQQHLRLAPEQEVTEATVAAVAAAASAAAAAAAAAVVAAAGQQVQAHLQVRLLPPGPAWLRRFPWRPSAAQLHGGRGGIASSASRGRLPRREAGPSPPSTPLLHPPACRCTRPRASPSSGCPPSCWPA
jgi:hypothetical protein